MFEDPPDAFNAQRYNVRSPTDFNQELQYSTQVEG
jgi:hypothetical protein